MARRTLISQLFAALVMSLTICVAKAASTTPLGIYAVKIACAAEGEARARTYLGIPLLQTPVFVGPATGVSGRRLSFNVFSPLPLDAGREYFVQVLNGPGAGFVSRVMVNEGDSVLCDKNLGAWISSGALFSIRPNHRLVDLFGADNRFGFASAANAAQSDKVVVWDALEQEERVYYFNSTRSRWEERGVEADAGNTPVRYPNGLYIVRHAATPLRIALRGEVSEYPVLLPLREGGNVFSLPLNLSASLDNLVTSSGPYAVNAGRNAALADILNFEDPVGVASRGPFYFRSKANDSGWRSVGEDDSAEPLLPLDPLSTLVIRHRGEEAYLRLNASLVVPPGGPYVPPADPEVGELPLEVEMTGPINNLPPDIQVILETSNDLVTWTPIIYTPRPDRRVFFHLPPGQSRAF